MTESVYPIGRSPWGYEISYTDYHQLIPQELLNGRQWVPEEYLNKPLVFLKIFYTGCFHPKPLIFDMAIYALYIQATYVKKISGITKNVKYSI